MPALTDARAKRLRRALLEWFDANRRDLPWRHRRSAYSVWLSEVMLQQTRADVVVPYYRRFLARFPTIAALAESPVDDVLAAWSGLGYYRRARFLHAGAQAVMRERGGRLPRRREQLETIPGIGEYTAAAIASIAFGTPVAALDANVTRVLSRVFAIEGDVAGGAARTALRELAARFVDPQRPGDCNEAMMDLGAGICTARGPSCTLCPLARLCEAAQRECPEDYPKRRARKPARRVRLAMAVVRGRSGARSNVLFVRRGDREELMPGMWDLPSVEACGDEDPLPQLREQVRSGSGMRVDLHGPVATVRHAIVGRNIVVDVYVASASGARIATHRTPDAAASGNGRRDAEFFEEQEWKMLAVSSLPLKVLRAAGEVRSGRAAPPVQPPRR